MPIISEFEPITAILQFLDYNGETITTDKEYWVRLIPPTFREQRVRDDYLDVHYQPGVGLVNKSNNKVLKAMEIWLTFGGTNLEVEVPSMNEDGTRKTELNAENKYVPAYEVVTFPETGDKSHFTQKEFMQKIDRFPSFVIDAWHYAVINNVAKDWVLPF